MKKQKLSLNLSLALTILASLMNAMATRVYAGAVNAQGSTSESTGYTGGNLNPANQTINPQLTPGIGNSVELKNGQILVSPSVQTKVNAVASRVINQVAISESIDVDSSENIILSDDKTVNSGNGGENIGIDSAEFSTIAMAVAILRRESNAGTAASRIKNALIEAGVKPESVEKLIEFMQGIITSSSSSAFHGTPVAKKSHSAQLVASNKSFLTGPLLAQNSQLNVDINKLNATINAYNDIIKSSDTKTLKKLAANPEFMVIRNILNQFRTALNS